MQRKAKPTCISIRGEERGIKRNTKRKVAFSIRNVLILVFLISVTLYSFIHFDQENESNTFSRTEIITDYEIHHLRGGTIYINFSCQDKKYFFVDCEGSIPDKLQRSFSQKITFYSEMFEGFVNNQEKVLLTSTKEKDLTHVYGHGRSHVVEIKLNDKTVLSIEGHNRSQRFKQRVLFVTISICCLFVIWRCWMHMILNSPKK